MPTWLQRFVDFLKRLFGSRTTVPPLVPKPLVQPPLNLETDEPPNYRKNKSLLTFQERKFLYTVLIKEVGTQYRIYVKVRFGDLIWIVNESKDKRNYSNQLQCKHIDFVLCHASSLEPVLAIELDDSSHSQYDRRESDELKNRVCDEADLPLLRVKVQSEYPISEIGAEIRKLLDNTGVVSRT